MLALSRGGGGEIALYLAFSMSNAPAAEREENAKLRLSKGWDSKTKALLRSTLTIFEASICSVSHNGWLATTTVRSSPNKQEATYMSDDTADRSIIIFFKPVQDFNEGIFHYLFR